MAADCIDHVIFKINVKLLCAPLATYTKTLKNRYHFAFNHLSISRDLFLNRVVFTVQGHLEIPIHNCVINDGCEAKEVMFLIDEKKNQSQSLNRISLGNLLRNRVLIVCFPCFIYTYNVVGFNHKYTPS